MKDASGEIVNWAVEWASPLDSRRGRLDRDVVKVGDAVTVEGWLGARRKQAGQR